MDYESITNENRQTVDAELINQAERQEVDEQSKATITRCDWNYVYDEVV